MDTTAIFNALYSSITEGRATVRAGTVTIARALCASLTRTGKADDQGLSVSADMAVRYLIEDDAQKGETAIGKKIEVTMSASGETYSVRILARTPEGDVLVLALQGITD